MFRTDRLEVLRKDHKLTQKELADIIGVERSTYVRYENGGIQPPNDMIVKFADYFDVTTDYLLGRGDSRRNNRIKELRELRDIKQNDFAKVLNVSQGTLSNWERGVHDPDTESLLSLANYFNVTIDYLLGRSDSPSPVNAVNQNPAPKTTHAIMYIPADNGSSVIHEVDIPPEALPYALATIEAFKKQQEERKKKEEEERQAKKRSIFKRK